MESRVACAELQSIRRKEKWLGMLCLQNRSDHRYGSLMLSRCLRALSIIGCETQDDGLQGNTRRYILTVLLGSR